MGQLKELAQNKPDEKQLGRVEAIINSMTPGERRQPHADQRQPAQAHRARQRHVGRGGQPPAQAVRRDEEDAEGRGRPRPGRRRQGRHAEEDGRAAADDAAGPLGAVDAAKAADVQEGNDGHDSFDACGLEEAPFFRVVVIEGAVGPRRQRSSRTWATTIRAEAGVRRARSRAVRALGVEGRQAVEHGEDAGGAQPAPLAPEAAARRPRRPRRERRRRAGHADAGARSSRWSAGRWPTSPTLVRVTEAQHRGMTVVELFMAPGDIGRVIGRQGRTAQAVRDAGGAGGREDRRQGAGRVPRAAGSEPGEAGT